MAYSYADYYSNPATNPRGVVPTSSRPGGSVGANAWAQNVPSEYRNYANQGATYHGFVNQYNQYATSGGTPSPGGGGGSTGGGGGGWGGGGWGGGGGGGGGAPAMSQGQFDMMLKLLGAQGPDLDLARANLPTFRGKMIAPFRAQMYNRMQQRLNQAVAADRGEITRTSGQLRNQLTADYSNPFESAQFAVNPVMQSQMQAALAATGANPLNAGYAESVNAENAYGQSSDAAFSNLMNVLGAANQQEQTSRLAQVGMDRAEAINRINASALGLGTGIDLAKGKAKEAWQVRADERRYQNLLTRQQWNREERMRNQDVRNLERQTEYKAQTESRESRIQALLDLISSTTGANIDIKGVNDLIARWGGSVGPAPRGGGRKGKGKGGRGGNPKLGQGRLSGKGNKGKG